MLGPASVDRNRVSGRRASKPAAAAPPSRRDRGRGAWLRSRTWARMGAGVIWASHRRPRLAWWALSCMAPCLMPTASTRSDTAEGTSCPHHAGWRRDQRPPNRREPGYDALLAVAPQRRLSVALRISDDQVCSPGTMRKPLRHPRLNPARLLRRIPGLARSTGSGGCSGVLRRLRLSSPLSYAPVSTARADRYIQTTVPIDAPTLGRRARRAGRWRLNPVGAPAPANR